MAVILSELKDAIVSNIILSGKDKMQAKEMAEHGVRLAAKSFWRAYHWSFSFAGADLTIAANDATGIALPADCEAVVGIRRQTSSDYGQKLDGKTADRFDLQTPYPDVHTDDKPVSYKVDWNSSTDKPELYVFPVADASYTYKLTYKLKFDLNQTLKHIPSDFEALIYSAAVWQCTPTMAMDKVSIRNAAYNEWKSELADWKKRDKPILEKLVERGQFAPDVWSEGSWQYIIAGGAHEPLV